MGAEFTLGEGEDSWGAEPVFIGDPECPPEESVLCSGLAFLRPTSGKGAAFGASLPAAADRNAASKAGIWSAGRVEMVKDLIFSRLFRLELIASNLPSTNKMVGYSG